jgi:hypothetical protein
MHDDPGLIGGKATRRHNTASWDFEVCAICSKSQSKGTEIGIGDVFACMQWGMSLQIEGSLWNRKIASWKRYVENVVWSSHRSKSVLQDVNGQEQMVQLGAGGSRIYRFHGVRSAPSSVMQGFLNSYFPPGGVRMPAPPKRGDPTDDMIGGP